MTATALILIFGAGYVIRGFIPPETLQTWAMRAWEWVKWKFGR